MDQSLLYFLKEIDNSINKRHRHKMYWRDLFLKLKKSFRTWNSLTQVLKMTSR